MNILFLVLVSTISLYSRKGLFFVESISSSRCCSLNFTPYSFIRSLSPMLFFSINLNTLCVSQPALPVGSCSLSVHMSVADLKGTPAPLPTATSDRDVICRRVISGAREGGWKRVREWRIPGLGAVFTLNSAVLYRAKQTVSHHFHQNDSTQVNSN